MALCVGVGLGLLVGVSAGARQVTICAYMRTWGIPSPTFQESKL